MFANLRTLKSEDRSPNPTFPRCKYGQIKAEFALQRQPSVICRFSHNLKHSSAPPSKSLTSLPSDAHLHLDQPSINANTYPTPAQTSLYIIFPPTSSGNGINCFHKTQNNILNDLCSSAWSSFPLCGPLQWGSQWKRRQACDLLCHSKPGHQNLGNGQG